MAPSNKVYLTCAEHGEEVGGRKNAIANAAFHLLHSLHAITLLQVCLPAIRP